MCVIFLFSWQGSLFVNRLYDWPLHFQLNTMFLYSSLYVFFPSLWLSAIITLVLWGDIMEEKQPLKYSEKEETFWILWLERCKHCLHAFTSPCTKTSWQKKVEKRKINHKLQMFNLSDFCHRWLQSWSMKLPSSPQPWKKPVKLGSIFLVTIPIVLSWEDNISKKVCSILEMLMGWQHSPKSF